MSNEGTNRPYDPAGTRPKVDPATLKAVQPPPDLPWAEREQRAESRLEDAVERFEEVRVVEEPGGSQHLGRFQFILGGLIAVAVLAVAAIAVVIVAGRSDQPSTSWSAWHPSGSDPLQEIADHVGATYRLGNGRQIAVVTGGPLKVGPEPKVGAQVVREDARTKQLQIEDGKTALFTLCGNGTNCAVEGKSSLERGLYVRREALELALYAMHYTDAEQVVVILPPPDPTSTLDRAIFLRRSDLGPELGQPLRDTLPSPAPKLAAVRRSHDIGLVDQVTGAGLYAFQFKQASDLSVFMVLGDINAAAQAAQAATLAGTTTVTPQTGTTTTPQTATTTTPQATTPAQKKPQQAKGKSGKSGG